MTVAMQDEADFASDRTVHHSGHNKSVLNSKKVLGALLNRELTHTARTTLPFSQLVLDLAKPPFFKLIFYLRKESRNAK